MRIAATTELTGLPRSPLLSTFFDNLDSFAEAPEGVAKLRELTLDLAVRRKLFEQDENDEPTSELVKLAAEKHKTGYTTCDEKTYPTSGEEARSGVELGIV